MNMMKMKKLVVFFFKRVFAVLFLMKFHKAFCIRFRGLFSGSCCRFFWNQSQLGEDALTHFFFRLIGSFSRPGYRKKTDETSEPKFAWVGLTTVGPK